MAAFARPFGPSGIEASASGSVGERLAQAGSHFGFRLRNKTRAELELRWDVRLRISRFGPDGSPVELISGSSDKIETISPGVGIGVLVDAPREPGSYRADIDLFDQEGELLGSYFEYIRVVPKTLHMRLGLTRRVVPPGGLFKARIETWEPGSSNTSTHMSSSGMQTGTGRGLRRGKGFSLPSMASLQVGPASVRPSPFQRARCPAPTASARSSGPRSNSWTGGESILKSVSWSGPISRRESASSV